MVSKGFPLTYFLSYEKEGVTGWGEAAPGKNENAGSVEEIESQLNILIAKGIENNSVEEINRIAKELSIAPCANAALDIAIWDWKAKKKGYPYNDY